MGALETRNDLPLLVGEMVGADDNETSGLQLRCFAGSMTFEGRRNGWTVKVEKGAPLHPQLIR